MNKYGHLRSDKTNFPIDEPYFVLRGKDLLAPAAIEGYANLLRSASAGADAASAKREGDLWTEQLRQMASEVSNVAAEMIAWQAANPERVKLPD